MANNRSAVLGVAVLGSMVLCNQGDGLYLIADRTTADLERVQYLRSVGFENMTEAEQAEFLQMLKGAYGYTDLNRVGNAVRYVGDKLKAAGNAVYVNPKMDWVRGENPTTDQRDNYLADVRSIRSVLSVYPNTPNVPETMERLTTQKANKIEQILLDVDGLIDKMNKSYYYSGEIYGGEI